MKRTRRVLTGFAVVLLAAGCGEKEPAATVTAGERAAEVAVLPVASHLGFATRVPKDADVFLAGYHADEALRTLVETFMGSGEMEKHGEEMDAMIGRIGGEHWVFVGAGAGRKLELLLNSHRQLSASMTETVAGGFLDGMAGNGLVPGGPDFADALPDDFVSRWLDGLVKDGRLDLPPVVFGWRPAEGRADECMGYVREFAGLLFRNGSQVEEIAFEVSGGDFTGHTISGADAFGARIEEARAELGKMKESGEALGQLPVERLEEALDAFGALRFTVASGIVDGRVLLYIGNGTEGLQLAEAPEDSLAGTDELRWTSGFAERRHHGMAYLSNDMVRSVLPLFDNSLQWKALAAAVRDPIRERNGFRGILAGMAGNSELLSRRDASAWTAVCFEDRGLCIETRGGWPDPGIDYTTPLRMADVPLGETPVLRAHWRQNRARKDLEWRQVEHLGALTEAVAGEFLNRGDGAATSMVPEDVVRRCFREIRELNRIYRDEFRAGLGDEVAVIADLAGEVPALPGMPPEVAELGSVPRFVVARPVTDRTKITAAGKSLETAWRGLSGWAGETAGVAIPAILPQSIESGGLVTWFAPAPFIGGDFVPGVTLNDEIWMLGTSRSMAAGLAKAVAAGSGGGQTGVVVDIDFAPVRDWCGRIYQIGGEEARSALEESMAGLEIAGMPKPPGVDTLAGPFRRIEGVHYRHRIEDGRPRTSFRIRVSPAAE